MRQGHDAGVRTHAARLQAAHERGNRSTKREEERTTGCSAGGSNDRDKEVGRAGHTAIRGEGKASRRGGLGRKDGGRWLVDQEKEEKRDGPPRRKRKKEK